MTEQVRERALRALQNAEAAVGDDRHFPMVFTIGKHVFFTYMAAVRMKHEMKIFHGIDLPIEKVVSPYKDGINKNVEQHGDLYTGEVFPSREYARLIAQ